MNTVKAPGRETIKEKNPSTVRMTEIGRDESVGSLSTESITI
jgi:hypothetical protein